MFERKAQDKGKAEAYSHTRGFARSEQRRNRPLFTLHSDYSKVDECKAQESDKTEAYSHTRGFARSEQRRNRPLFSSLKDSPEIGAALRLLRLPVPGEHVGAI